MKTKKLNKKGSLAKGSQMTEEEDMKKLVEMKDKARKAEALKTARELLKGDKENLSKLGKHKLMAFYDKRFDKENDGKGCVMLVFGDTLNMSFQDSVLVASYANAKIAEPRYAVDTNSGTLFRLDGKPVTLEDGELMMKSFEELSARKKPSNGFKENHVYYSKSGRMIDCGDAVKHLHSCYHSIGSHSGHGCDCADFREGCVLIVRHGKYCVFRDIEKIKRLISCKSQREREEVLKEIE